MDVIELKIRTPDQAVQDLCRKYWARDWDGTFFIRVAELAEEFNIPKSKVHTTVTEHCVAYSRSDSCSRCDGYRSFGSRADFLDHLKWRRDVWVCADCREAARIAKEHEAQLSAQHRIALLERELERKRRPGLSIGCLSFRDTVYLVSLLRAGGAEDLSDIAPLESLSSGTFSPTSVQDRAILDHLYSRGIICVHPSSRPDSVVINDGEFRWFDPAKVHWVLPIAIGGPTPASFQEDLEELLRSQQWREEWGEEAAELHRDLALEECLQYLSVVMADHGFVANRGERICGVLRTVLNRFSIGQTYSFIWRAAKDAASFYMREKPSMAHAANIVPGAIQRMADHALAAGWDINSFHRDFRVPLSRLTEVLFSVALRLPEGGFTTISPTEGTRTTAGVD